ncbi:MAG: hypothetical protein C0408_06475 [Odoribacter sp.]|nr:hypothetical protein [Odoribacter sp.]
MKNLFFATFFIMIGAVSFSQPRLQLLTTDHDFGVFKEEAGRQTFNFIVTNTGDSALFIMNVVPSCGCTTPEWTQSPIPPKGQGKITAIYDPAGRPGVFSKTLAVHSNAKPGVIVLVIKGEVKPKEKTVEELFTFPVGPIRFESNHLAFTNIKKNDKRIRVMPVINTSAAPVKLEFDGLPPHLELRANPETLKPGQKGLVEGTYEATKNQGWGNVSDMIKIKINGVVQNNVYYYVSANLIEDFSGLSKTDLENAPVFKLEATTVDIGTMDPATNRDVEFKFRNEGKSDLNIRHIKATCGCTAVQQGGTVVKPGQESSIKATFNSGGYKGKVTKAIYVYTDDPKNSEVVLFLNAEIVEKTTGK